MHNPSQRQVYHRPSLLPGPGLAGLNNRTPPPPGRPATPGAREPEISRASCRPAPSTRSNSDCAREKERERERDLADRVLTAVITIENEVR